ncbi:hypothetical protein LWI29_017819 [Acer saccharum]|uniref:Tf2-1-like SH3-like domain-containing protein n=1 Tax=Acer saccharum TaxID=4024 RepID=A0AA39SSV4_ACESA|nr:hypothetical protein LWI29_017819 [Acer saccharum]
MDFIEGLPPSQGKNTILVVIDRLTKYAHFLTLSHPYNAQQVAQVFFDQIHKLHGIPTTIPYRQNTVAFRRNLKLAPKFYGPYQILAKIRKVAYRLQLPPSSMVHPVFHVSQLKKKVGDLVSVNPELPRVGPDGQFLVYPVAVLKRKLVKRHNSAVVQFLVQWSNAGPEDSTWEDSSVLTRHFLDFQP